MKKIITTVMALTLALGMSVTALAAPSPSQGVDVDPKDQVKVEVAPGTTLTAEEQAVVDAWSAADSWDVESKTEIPTADADAAEKAALAGATDKDAAVVAYGEVTVGDEIAALVNAGKITVTLPMTLTGVTTADNGNIIALVFHDGKWEAMKTEVVGDGRVNVTFTHFSPVAFVQLTAKATAPTSGWTDQSRKEVWDQIRAAQATQAGATSPKTGDAGVVGFALIAVACGAALVFTKKKFA